MNWYISIALLVSHTMHKDSKIYVAGHNGLVGSAFMHHLTNKGFANIITASHSQLDLKDYDKTKKFFKKHKPDYVILAAAKVGGINANKTYPADFLYDNLAIQNNIFKMALETGVKKLMFLGSSCIYPKGCPQPMKEEYLLTGPLEPTNEGYALAKIAGLKLAQFFYKQYGLKSICLMPCNLYGPNDSFHPENSHVMSALIRKFTDATRSNKKDVTLWGSGIARREFMHVDDLARIATILMNKIKTPDIINIGTGSDMSIKQLAKLIAKKTGYKGRILWDTSMPDGMLKKRMGVKKMLTLGVKTKIKLEDGIDDIIAEYKAKK
jgi:GDP-L-fucose synthase